ncbi:MAG: RimK family alpha-L-glutamate ligase [Clostridia bacterium]|nr:RimK family alpha-L-glutamate ligase [Clostridia bacterium]MBQ1965346.1 RimK family alpha-L-glutamate ligase [Clostridia bacterium]
MNQKYAVIYNRSLERIFGQQARAVAKELDCQCLYTDEIQFLADDEITFEKCVYFDKDVITGLRLELLGVRLYNNIGAIELCDDKRRCGELLRRDLNVPETLCAPLLFGDDGEFRKEFANKVGEQLGFPLIGKLAFGSLGQQVKLIETKEELLKICDEWKKEPHLFQKYVASSKGKDLRIYVVDGKAVAAMERYNPDDFRSNIGAGGHGTKVTPSKEFEQAAIDACSLLGLDFGGVDLLYGENGEPVICEVNSNALFRELNAVCGVQVEQYIADAVKSEPTPFDLSAFGF